MFAKTIYVLIVVIYSVKCAKIMVPAVYEDFNDTPMPMAKLKKLVILDKAHRHPVPFQPDQQLNRYRKQQELDSYIQAYRDQQVENQKINAQQLQWHAIVSKQTTSKSKTARQPKSVTTKPKSDAKAATFALVTRQPYKVQEASDQEIEASEVTNARLDHGHKHAQITVQYPFVLAPNYVGKASVVVNSHQQTPHFPQTQQNLFPVQKPLESSESQLHSLTYSDNFKIVPSKELVNPYVLGQFQNQDYEAYLSKLLPNYLHQQVAVKEYTPITEEAHDSTHHIPESTHKSTHPTSVIPLAHENPQSSQYASKYAFGYRVRDYHAGNDFGHEETRNGDTAKGHYHVLLPDGRIQNVNYHAGPDGYHATVTYHH